MRTAEATVTGGDEVGGRKRLLGLDIIRGTYIVLALWQHFAGYLTERNLPVDATCYFIYRYLTPSGDQIFLALAAFNLASRKQREFVTHYRGKLQVFHLLFWFFLLENITVANNLGDGLSWGPMLTWMVLLALVATVFRFVGFVGVLGIFVLHLIMFFLPMQIWNDRFEQFIRDTLQLPYFVYESRLDLFLGSACIGFLCGYLYHHGAKPWRLHAAFTAGAVLCLPFLLFGSLPKLDPAHIWASEYAVTHSTIGLASIWGTILMMISGMLLLEGKGLVRRLPLLTWCGEHSLFIFAIHRVLFVRVILPVTVHIFLLFGWTAQNTIWMLLVYSGLVFLLAWIALRARFFQLLAR